MRYYVFIDTTKKGIDAYHTVKAVNLFDALSTLEKAGHDTSVYKLYELSNKLN